MDGRDRERIGIGPFRTECTVNRFVIFIAVASISAAVRAQEARELSDEPTFRQIFRQSVADAASLESARRRDALTLELSGLVVSPEKLVLTNAYFKVPHDRVFTSLPGFQASGSFGLAGARWARLGGVVSTGYSYVQGVGRATSQQTKQASIDALTLQRIPLTAGLRATFDSAWASFFAESAIGLQFLTQTGRLDGLSQSFRVATASGTVGVVLFDQTLRSNDWFGGLKLSAGVEKALGTSQTLQLKRFEAGLRARL